jgi:hypothetical protein
MHRARRVPRALGGQLSADVRGVAPGLRVPVFGSPRAEEPTPVTHRRSARHPLPPDIGADRCTTSGRHPGTPCIGRDRCHWPIAGDLSAQDRPAAISGGQPGRAVRRAYPCGPTAGSRTRRRRAA